MIELYCTRNHPSAFDKCDTKEMRDYSSLLKPPSEVNLSEFIRNAQKRGQSVCVPVVDATKRVMEFGDLPVDFERQNRIEEDLVLLTQKKGSW